MNQKLKRIIYIVAFIIVLIGIAIFLNIKNLQKIILSEIENANNNIIEINEDEFEKEVLNSKKKVLLDFYATWCEPCQTFAPTIEEFANEYKDIKVVKIDIDKCKELVDKYEIQALPTIIVIEKGNEINRLTGVSSKDRILQMCGKNK